MAILTRDEMFQKAREAIAEVIRIDKEKVQTESLFIEDLGADSLDLTSLLLELEDVFGIVIEIDEAEDLKTVNDVLDLMEKAIAEQGSTDA